MYIPHRTQLIAAISKNTKRDEIPDGLEINDIVVAADGSVQPELNYQSDHNQLDFSIARPDFTKKVHLQPRANTIPDTLGLPSDAGTQAGGAAGPGLSYLNTQFPAMELIVLPLVIMKWLGNFWGGFEGRRNPYRGGRRGKRDLQSPPIRRAHARSWKVVE